MIPKKNSTWLCLLFTLLLLQFLLNACTKSQSPNADAPEGLVFVKGGNFTNQHMKLHQSPISVADFYLGKYEVTQKEWVEVMGTNPSKFKFDNHPVESVSWYDAIVYCNARSLKEALQPYYQVDSMHLDRVNTSVYDTLKWTVKINPKANGYRLPTELEWVYAASGGAISQNFTFSGHNNVDEAAWFWKNSGDKLQAGQWNYAAMEGNNSSTHQVGLKMPNELGLYDMSGNVYELCHDWYEEAGVPAGESRVLRGGSWAAVALTCELTFRHFFVPNNKSGDVGFRVCRNI